MIECAMKSSNIEKKKIWIESFSLGSIIIIHLFMNCDPDILKLAS